MRQVRKSAQNVAERGDLGRRDRRPPTRLALLPGMTANVRVVIESRETRSSCPTPRCACACRGSNRRRGRRRTARPGAAGRRARRRRSRLGLAAPGRWPQPARTGAARTQRGGGAGQRMRERLQSELKLTPRTGGAGRRRHAAARRQVRRGARAEAEERAARRASASAPKCAPRSARCSRPSRSRVRGVRRREPGAQRRARPHLSCWRGQAAGASNVRLGISDGASTESERPAESPEAAELKEGAVVITRHERVQGRRGPRRRAGPLMPPRR